MEGARKIAIIGLGYVGLSLAAGFGSKVKVIGYDKKSARIEELKKGNDRNNEFSSEALKPLDIKYTSKHTDLRSANFYIITVPTPVTDTHIPDLSILKDASKIVGKYLKKGDVVVYESTVYPGATEEICVPILIQHSKLEYGKDFKVGYSPERINPGDKKHSLANTVKIISGQDEQTADLLESVYSLVVKAGLYRAPSIKVAEAAKVIENTQRDLNVSLINEITLIMHCLKIDTHEVLKAAQTKWNFLPYQPGLVGGHCIGVDPYYLTYKAQEVGYFPEIILSGRRTNNYMPNFIAESTIKNLINIGTPIKHCRIAILGITFKENCADTRNSRVFDLMKELLSYGVNLIVCDPVANSKTVEEEHHLSLVPWKDITDVDAIIFSVAHNQFLKFSPEEIKQKLNFRGLIIDVKCILNPNDFNGSGVSLWRL